jgi:glycosyltransferase involved in cell wall biosynthesis
MVGDDRENYAIYVGRLSQEKGLLTLVDAFERVPDIPLRIYGDGPLRTNLERKAEKLKLKIEFMGYQPRAKILAHVRKAQLLVVPSEWYEGFPMVVLEAYASGTPVLASRIGSLDEIVVDNETGFKFEPGNALDMAEKLRLFFTDASRREHMSRCARTIFEEKYTAEKNLGQLLAIYEQALSGIPSIATVKPQ